MCERHNTASHLKALSELISSADKQDVLARHSMVRERPDLLITLNSETLSWAAQHILSIVGELSKTKEAFLDGCNWRA